MKKNSTGRLYIASRNKNKKREIEALLKGTGIKVLSLDEVHRRLPVIIENGKTFKQNAIKKAVTISRVLDSMAIADDSGIETNFLSGLPGVRSARFARPKADDRENNAKLLKLMRHAPAARRGARFVCAIAVADNGHLVGTVEGECRGRIGLSPRGDNGFGYDPLFIPDGYTLTFAEMKPSFKNGISHRGRALKKAIPLIVRHLERTCPAD
ncbi:MAG: RdgB/HAM1 family non-canonical purine NTP pyrophosphatase [Candidatus Omnitrophota bacterium]